MIINGKEVADFEVGQGLDSWTVTLYDDDGEILEHKSFDNHEDAWEYADSTGVY